MAITTARGTITRMRKNQESILLRVEGGTDREATTSGLQAATPEISDLGGSYVSDAMPTREGPVLYIDAGGVPSANVRSILDVIARHLEAAGVHDATIVFPETTSTLAALEWVPKAVALHLFVAPPRLVSRPGSWPQEWVSTELPSAWIDEAATWVSEGKAPADELWVRRGVVDFTLPATDIRPQLEGGSLVVAAKAPGPRRTDRQLRSFSNGQLRAELAARLGGRVRGANTVPRSHLVLAAGGPDASDDDLLDAYEQLQDIARSLAPDVTYGYIWITNTLAPLIIVGIRVPWCVEGGPDVGGTIGYLRDELVFDGFAYQILSPGHLARCADLPAGTRPLAGGRVEVPIGDFGDWLPDHAAIEQQTRYPYVKLRNPTIQHHARRVLAPWLVTEEEGGGLSRVRYGF
jgi:hypothetical protein